jgi:zinc D-Ala-D-Ala dipeptidase
VDIREACPGIATDAPLPWARARVCRMLCKVRDRLPSGLRLLVSTSLRTLDMQAAAWEIYRDHLRSLHPTWPNSVLARETNRFLHPPHAAAPPGHTTGGAVDVRLVDETGGELEGFREPLGGGHRLWHTFSTAVPAENRALRQALYDAMIRVGFSNCYDEWWHYSWGDSGWAARLGHETAIYGAVPEERYPPALAAEVAAVRAAGTLTRVRRRLE